VKFKKSFYLFIICDIIFICLSFLFFIWIKPASKSFYLPQYAKPFFIFSIIWVGISYFSKKYFLDYSKRILYLFIDIIKRNFLIFALIAICIYIFQTPYYSRLIVFGTIITTTFFEFGIVSFISYHRRVLDSDIANIKITTNPNLVDINESDEKIINYNIPLPKATKIDDSAYPLLKDNYLRSCPTLFDFIDVNIHIADIPKLETFVLKTHTLYNIENVEALSKQLFINLHKINDFRRINVYLIEVNKILQYGGYFISYGYAIEERKKDILEKYPPVLNYILYSTDFILKRVMPKLPICKECYFAITKGKNRAISKAEILGRLYFCGFRVINTTLIDNSFYFITQKINIPKQDPHPTYGPLIKLKRIGKDGKIINVYKFRTMHPYSEYLQSYIYEQNKLQEGGKFANDFRVTTLGKCMRKLWIDELPMFINLFKGQLKIVGVRPLSIQYFNLYPKEFQEIRIKYKPGLIPPFYVDLPKTFDEIIESEKKYLAAYDKHPFRTDMNYFFKAIYNILFKKARSK
jgi:lipopolysaccharide/colanic/teichoic acid biosynthesis glycosyltransferase